jgi:enoyl-[acyl-carrier protein] reductase II
MRTRLTELLGIEHPIIQAGMVHVSFPSLVAAASNAGGLGILGAGTMSPPELRENIRQVKALTDRPFGVNVIPDNTLLEELLDVIVEEGVAVASFGVGNPQRIIGRTRPQGIINIPTVGSLKHALRAEQSGADAVIVQGTEAGGHASHVATMVLTPLVAERVKIPVVAAGGFCDGRGLVAALALGAEGIAMGSRFIITQESPVPQNIKEMILRATEEDTVVTRNFTGVRCRVLRNRLAEQLLELEEKQAPSREFFMLGLGKFRKAFVDGDGDMGSVALGQVCGRIEDLPTCQELIDRIVTEAQDLLGSLIPKITSPIRG